MILSKKISKPSLARESKMVFRNLFALVLLLSFVTVAQARGGRITVEVSYKHRDLQVHYALPCEVGKSSTLTSLDGVRPKWRLILTPSFTDETQNLGVDVEIDEDGFAVQKARFLLRPGTNAILQTSGPATSDYTSLSLAVRKMETQ